MNAVGVAVAILCAVLVAALITGRIVHRKKPIELNEEASSSLRSELELRRGRRNDGITLFLENNGGQTLKACGITIAMLSRFYEGMGFIRPFEFTTINLLLPQDLSPGQKSNEVYLVQNGAYPDGYPYFGNPAANSRPRTVPEPGIWRAELHIFAVPANAYTEDVFFQWRIGTKPDFTSNPIPSEDQEE